MSMDMYDYIVRVAADWLVVPIIAIAGIVMLRLPGATRWPLIGKGIMAGLLALLLAKLASLLYQQGQRPFEALGVDPGAAYLNNPGFPSDHALLVFAAVFVVWASTKNVKLSLVLLTMAVIVAVGRVLALVHTPLDVLGGAACAFLAAAIIYRQSFFKR